MSHDYSIHYARFHEEGREHAERMAAHILAEIEPSLPPEIGRSGEVVDIGCGYGFGLLALKRLGFTHVLGLEISEQQALRARSLGLDVLVPGDVGAWLEANRARFSVALLLDVLEHIPEDRQIEFARSIYTSMGSGSRLLVQVPNASSIIASRWRYIDYTHTTSFTEHSLFYILRNAGFDRIDISAEKGLRRPSLRLWRGAARTSWKRWVIRWLWLQVYRAEIPWERTEDISLELNLKAVAFKQ